MYSMHSFLYNFILMGGVNFFNTQIWVLPLWTDFYIRENKL